MPARKTSPPRAPKKDSEITRAGILRKYWELANLDPEATKGTITGQLKALELLSAQLETRTDEADSRNKPVEIYQSAWLKHPVTRVKATEEKEACEQ